MNECIEVRETVRYGERVWLATVTRDGWRVTDYSTTRRSAVRIARRTLKRATKLRGILSAVEKVDE